MRVFVAGASGVIGRPLISRLVAEGHEVTGTTRSDERAERIRVAGARAAVCDVLNAEEVRAAVAEARPEVVIQQLTDLPPKLPPRKLPKAYEANDRVREEGTANLVAAAEEAGARRYIAQNVCFFYEPEGGPVKDETAPTYRNPPPPFDRSARVFREMEERVLTADLEGLVLRYGYWYGPGTQFHRDGFYGDEIRKRRFAVVGDGAGLFPFIHIDDVVEATVAAVERGAPGIYNVTDDDPAPMREWVPLFAEAIGAKRPFRVPLWVGRLFAGGFQARMGVTMRGADNGKAKRELGWAPRYPTWREGFREALVS